jgi:multiple sugar transport system permease protein
MAANEATSSQIDSSSISAMEQAGVHDALRSESAAGRAARLGLKTIAYGWLVIFAVATIMPLIWMVSTAFKPNELVLKIPPDIIPPNPTLDNFISFFRQRNAIQWIVNSIVVTTAITIGHLVIYSMAGYALAKLDFPGKRAMFGIVLVTLTIPVYVILIPLYRMMVDLGWINTYAGLIFPTLVGPASLFLMKQFMSTLPSSLIDAARVDACPEWRIFLRIVLPLAKPGLAVLAIFTFMGYWNSFVWPLIVTQTSEMRTLTVGLTTVRYSSFDYGTLMAGSVVAAAPMFIVFLVFQRYFLRGLTIGALKG